jgi:hypothetical protein
MDTKLLEKNTTAQSIAVAKPKKKFDLCNSDLLDKQKFSELVVDVGTCEIIIKGLVKYILFKNFDFQDTYSFVSFIQHF